MNEGIYKLFFSNATELFVVANQDGYFIEVNPAWERALGWSAQEMMTKPFIDFVHPLDRERTTSEYGKYRAPNYTKRGFVNRYRHKNGGWRWIEWFGTTASDGLIYCTASDITEQTRKRLIHAECEAIGNVGGWEYDQITDYIYWTPYTYQIFGVNSDSFVPTRESVAKFFDQNTRGLLAKCFEDLLKHAKQFSIEVPINRCGQTHWLVVSGSNVENDNQNTAYYGTVRDITDEKRRIGESIAQSKFLSALLENLPIAMFCKDYTNAGRFSVWNRSAERLYGYRREEVIGRNDEELLPSSMLDIVLTEDQLSIEHRGTVVFEHAMVIPDRHIDAVYRTLKVPVFDGEQLKYIIGMAEDITAQKLAEQKLLASEQFQNLIFKIAPVAIFRFDETAQITYANDKWIEMTGLSCRSCPMTSWYGIIHKEDRDLFKQNIDLLFENQTSFNQVFRCVRDDGVLFWVSGAFVPVTTKSGEAVEYLSTLSDITELKNLQQDQRRQAQLIQEQQLRMIASSKLSTLGEMAGNIAHEINNPLAIIGRAADLLQDGLEHNVLDKDSLLRLAHTVQKTVDRVDKIIKGLRSFARDGDNDPVAVVDLKTIILDTLNICRAKLRSLRIEVVLDLSIHDDLSVPCKDVQISQVLLNLLNNAVDAIVPAKNGWIRISATSTSSSVQLKVSDSGRGIGCQIQDKIMEPFFTTKLPGKGSGLGLSISKRIVEMHNGKLYLDSVETHTTFVIELPKTCISRQPGTNNRFLSHEGYSESGRHAPV